MSTATLVRLSGLVLLIAVPIQVLGWLVHPRGEELADLLSAGQRPAHLMMVVSWALVLVALPGLYARQAHRAGTLGLVSFALAMLAVAYHLYLNLYEAFAAPILAEHEATQAMIVTGGTLAHGVEVVGALASPLLLAFPLSGIATLRAGVLPRGAGWLQVLSVPVLLVGAVLLPPEERGVPGALTAIAILYYVLFAGYAWAGFALWTGKERVNQPAPRTPAPQPAA